MTITVKKRYGSRIVPQFLRDMLGDCNLHDAAWINDLMGTDEPFFKEMKNVAWAKLNAIERARWLTGQLYNDTGIMPSDLCSDVDLPAGSTYAVGVRKLRKAL